MSNSELAVSYAALILADDGIDVTADKLQTIIKAAGIDDVEPIWSSLFAKALVGKDIKDILLNVGSGGGAAATSAVAGEVGGDAVAEEKTEEKEEGNDHNNPISDKANIINFKEKEESDDDMGFGLFD